MAAFTNQASLSYGNKTVSSNIVTGQVVQTLSVTKTALPNSYQIGDTITYVVTLVNSGATSFDDLTLTDNLGAYLVGASDPRTTVYPLTYVDGSLRAFLKGAPQGSTPTVNAGPPLVLSDVSVPANSDLVLVYQARLADTASPETGGSVVNTVTLTGDDLSEDLTATATINAATGPNLIINKSVTPSSVVENGQITYTFTIQNLGNTATAGDVVLTDVFTPILSNLSVNFDGTPWTDGNQYNYTQANGTFTTTAGQISVPAATYNQDPDTGVWTPTPGVSVLTVTGTV